VSATATCCACLEDLREGELTRTIVLRGYFDVEGDAPLRLDAVQVHVDCDDPKGEHVVTCYPRRAR